MPCRTRDLCRVLESMGVTIKKPHKGSHWKAILGSAVYPIPIHNGLKTELDDGYVRGLCRAFGFDEADLRSRL